MTISLPGLQPKKIKPRVDFDMSSFRQRVYEKGVYLEWEMAGECPCQRILTVGSTDSTLQLMGQGERTGGTREPSPDCTECNGSGIIYHSKQTIRGLVIGAQNDFDRFRLYGEYAKGMVGLTLLPEHVPGILDRFTLKDNVLIFKETRQRTSGTVESLRYPIASRDVQVGTSSDATVAESKTLSVMYARKATTAGVISGDVLVAGTDFSVNSDGKIDWTLGVAAGTAPTTGEYYAMTYFANPRYVVANHPHAFRDTYTKKKSPTENLTNLPVKVDCLLEFLRDRDD